MKLVVAKGKWEASYGFAIIFHPFPGKPRGWTLDVLLYNRNYTFWIKG